MITRVSNKQLLLFPIPQRDLVRQLGIDIWAAKKLYDDKWLSFDPESTPITDEAMEAEFTFLGSLVAAGVDPHLLERLLVGLERPYQYDLNRIYYDWRTLTWKEFPVQPDSEDAVAELIDNCVDESDTDTLLQLRESVDNALRELGVLTDGNDGSPKDDPRHR